MSKSKKLNKKALQIMRRETKRAILHVEKLQKLYENIVENKTSSK